MAIADVAAWFPGEPDVISTLTNAAERRRPTRLHGRRANGVPFTLAIDVGLDEQSGWLVCTGREVAGEDLLSESRRYLDVAFEVAPVGMALFDTDGRYVRVNDALCRLLGRSKADLIGRRDQEFTQPGQRGRAS